MRRITASPRSSLRQASTMPRARSAGEAVCSEYSSSSTSPETQLAFAGAAVAGLAGEGKRHAGAQQRGEQVSPASTGTGSVAFHGDLHSRPGGAYASIRLFGSPTKRRSSRAARSPGCSATACALPSRRCSAISRASVRRGVSPGRAGILLLIDANPGVTQSRLARAVASRPLDAWSACCDALEERGLIERRRGEDRRTNGLWLTRAGRTLVARLKQRIELHERRVAAALTPAERGAADCTARKARPA